MVNDLCLIVHHFDQLHHSAIFVRQNVAVVNELTGKVGKVGPHFEVSRNDLAGGVLLAQRNWEGVPPYPWLRQFQRLFHGGWIKDFSHLEGVYVNVEWMSHKETGRVILDRPFLSRIQEHGLVNPAFFKTPVIDEGRRTWPARSIHLVLDDAALGDLFDVMQEYRHLWILVFRLRPALVIGLVFGFNHIHCDDDVSSGGLRSYVFVNQISGTRLAWGLDQKVHAITGRQSERGIWILKLRFIVVPVELNAVLGRLVKLGRICSVKTTDKEGILASLHRAVNDAPPLDFIGLHGNYRLKLSIHQGTGEGIRPSASSSRAAGAFAIGLRLKLL